VRPEEQKHVDAIMRGLQGSSEKTQVERFGALSVRLGMVSALATLVARLYDYKERPVAKVIEFYIPTRFSKRVKWIPLLQRGKVIEFSLPPKKSA
jgi:hypothetical protein